MGFPLISVHTNSMEFYAKGRDELKGPDALKTCACVYVLARLMKIYYFGSTYITKEFTFSTKDPAYYDLLTLQCISSDRLVFYSSGCEGTRSEKTKYICKSQIVQESLSTCITLKNCSVCNKYIRTMIDLYNYGVLDSYKNVYDVEDFKKNIAKPWI